MAPPDGRYSVCTVEAILDNCITEIVFCGLTLWKEMGIVEKDGVLPVFDTDILNTLPPPTKKKKTAEITSQLPCKIGSHLPSMEGLKPIQLFYRELIEKFHF